MFSYTPRLVRAVVASLYEPVRGENASELRADVVGAINRLHPLWRNVLVLQAQGYSGLEIGRKLLGPDANDIEGKLLVTIAELELTVELNKGRGKDDRGAVRGSGSVLRAEGREG